MGIFDKLGKALGIGKELSVDEFMTTEEAEDVDIMHQAADFYVKPIKLQTDEDIKLIELELTNKNIILLNITPIARNPVKLKAYVADIKNFVTRINGDLARLDEDKLLITPSNVKIVKKRQ